MHRAPILQLLAEYGARHPREAATVRRMTSFVEAHADCFQRSLSEGHLTGSAWLLDRGGQRALLTHHRKIGRWMQLGGHADGDPDLLAVALREAREESGIPGIAPLSPQLFDIDIHLIAARGEEPAHFHYDCRFLLHVTGDDAHTASDESHELRWLAMAEIGTLTREESVWRMVDKWRERSEGKGEAG